MLPVIQEEKDVHATKNNELQLGDLQTSSYFCPLGNNKPTFGLGDMKKYLIFFLKVLEDSWSVLKNNSSYVKAFFYYYFFSLCSFHAFSQMFSL